MLLQKIELESGRLPFLKILYETALLGGFFMRKIYLKNELSFRQSSPDRHRECDEKSYNHEVLCLLFKNEKSKFRIIINNRTQLKTIQFVT